ncbi:MAG: helix-turn-helix domain-containing protein [Nitrospinaceae bacterium]|nr:helix-turn-helix transcriptional regulator [Nitrospinaceae bacterium]NIU46719.1 helix-turn-helix transcriptional regulator [Nitrospinaceae bacterium]NIU98912.1 helix-turn-helix domain-containing protein [Nitrospinaceae bacterium]NIW08280.1 helix-turn-helix domain-containing protein [Nitrospinaceae bacterium]NIW61467.1 helix-turn-helix domain-containing protein [Nitrospinaceae bacterium]
MLDRNMSQTHLAQALGLTRNWLNHVIHGRQKAWGTRYRISRFLGVPIEDLWPDPDNGETPRASGARASKPER